MLVVGGFTACSKDSTSYCGSLKDEQRRLARLSADSGKPGRAGADALGDSVDLLARLGEEAPRDVSDEWETLVGAMRGLSTAIDESGAAPSDFAGGTRPDGVTTGQYAAVRQAGEELRSTRVQQAAASIEQHALDVCKVDLGSGLGAGG